MEHPDLNQTSNRKQAKLMEIVRWVIFVGIWAIGGVAMTFYMQKKHFNLFIPGLFALICLAIVVFRLTCKWQGFKNAELFEENEEQGTERKVSN